MTNKIPRFYNSKTEFKTFHEKLKVIKCPFCKLVGYLILHGYLQGYDENKDSACKRGRRIFCSNRNRRKGCGRTFSMLKSIFLKYFRLTSTTLWNFIYSLLSGKSKKDAWKDTNISISDSFLYDICRRLTINQSHIRTRLYDHQISLDNDHESIFNQLKYLKSPYNPIATFQYRFQDDFLKHRPSLIAL